jgi:hypothetical protein
MKPESFDGIWSCPSIIYPDIEEIICYDPRKRIIQFVIADRNPLKRLPMKLWYVVESPSRLRLTSRPGLKTWTCDFRFEHDQLILINRRTEYRCRRLTPTEYPDWLEKELARAHAKMDEWESNAEPGDSVNPSDG